MISLGGVAAGFFTYPVAAAGRYRGCVHPGAGVVHPQLAGAAYLSWLAWKAPRPGGEAVFAPRPLPPDSPRRLFAMGLVTNLLNPKDREPSGSWWGSVLAGVGGAVGGRSVTSRRGDP